MMVLVQLRPSYPIMTPRLLLRPLTVDDTDALLAHRGRADVCRYLPFEPMSLETLRARLARDLSTTAITEPGQSLTSEEVVNAAPGARAPIPRCARNGDQHEVRHQPGAGSTGRDLGRHRLQPCVPG